MTHSFHCALKTGIDLWAFHSPSFSGVDVLPAAKCQKPNCILDKTKQKDALIARLSTCKAENSRHRGNEF